MLTDDLPWPELGNVSRGATRGNQGQKGVLGQPDNEGRAVLQLRVQPGVLAVRLNRQASDWYRILDSEVNRALKLTKTYWRKARRRQDYDARADQDHMELHEWLQQLKDKVMSHLELLMQKGDIVGEFIGQATHCNASDFAIGPPYVMPDDADLPFLAKFIERHNAGIAHNPRLRNAPQEQRTIHGDEGIGSVSPDVPELGDVGDPSLRGAYSKVSLTSEYMAHAHRQTPCPILTTQISFHLRCQTVLAAQGILLSPTRRKIGSLYYKPRTLPVRYVYQTLRVQH